MPEPKSVTTSSGPGNIRFQTPSAILAFAPLKTAFVGAAEQIITNAENIYKSSSSAISGSTVFPAGDYTLLDWTDTRLYYLGANLLTNAGVAYGWGSSASSSYSGSLHNPLFWMYTSASTFSLNHTNLYYTTFQSKSTDQGFVETGSLPSYLAQLRANGIDPTSPTYSEFTLPPITSPAYNYQLIVSRSIRLYNTTGNSSWRTIKDWTCTSTFNNNDGLDPSPTQYQKDSLRSGSSSTDKTLNGANVQGNFNTSSGFYFFVRNNLPGQDTTYIRSIPLEYTFSAEVEQTSVDYNMSFGITSASLQSNNTLVSQSSPLISSSRVIVSGSAGGYQLVTWSGSFDLFQPTPPQNNGLSITDTSSIAANSREGIIFQLSSSVGIVFRILSASLDIKQSLTGRQVAFPIPIDTVTTTPTQNDTGSYLVITPYLNFGAGTGGNVLSGQDNLFDSTIYSTGASDYTTRFDFRFAVYYFKTAYALWRDGWRVTAHRGNNQSNTTSDQLNWLNASSCPSWAAKSGSNGLFISSRYVRNPGWLYASRSADDTFIDYGTSSTDPAVRNRSYVGIAAELLGGSELIPHLKNNFENEGGGGVSSASFSGAQFGGAIVVKRSQVSFSSSIANERAIPSSASNGHIYYYPGIASSSVDYTITNDVDNTIAAVGLPLTMVNDCDVVPLSLWYYDPNIPTSLFWPTDVSGWPRTEVGNYYEASDAIYGYDGYTF